MWWSATTSLLTSELYPQTRLKSHWNQCRDIHRHWQPLDEALDDSMCIITSTNPSFPGWKRSENVSIPQTQQWDHLPLLTRPNANHQHEICQPKSIIVEKLTVEVTVIGLPWNIMETNRKELTPLRASGCSSSLLLICSTGGWLVPMARLGREEHCSSLCSSSISFAWFFCCCLVVFLHKFHNSVGWRADLSQM